MGEVEKRAGGSNPSGVTGIKLLSIVFIISSCSGRFNGETATLIEKMKLMEVNENISHILTVDSLEILNGGLPPKIFKQYSDETIYSELEKDIVFIEFDSVTNVQKLQFKDLDANSIHLLRHNYKKGDTIFVSKFLEDDFIHFTIGKNSEWKGN